MLEILLLERPDIAVAEYPHRLTAFDVSMAVEYGYALYSDALDSGTQTQGFSIRDPLGATLCEWRSAEGLGLLAALSETAAVASHADTFPARHRRSGSPVRNERTRQKQASTTERKAMPTPRIDALRLRVVSFKLRVWLKRAETWLRRGADNTLLPVQSIVRRKPTSVRPSIAASKLKLPHRAWHARLRRALSANIDLDHVVLAAVAIVILLVAPPLQSIYNTAKDLGARLDPALERVVAGSGTLPSMGPLYGPQRSNALQTISTDGAVDFRKLFWHLRVVGPNEIDLRLDDSASTAPTYVFRRRALLFWDLCGRKTRNT